MIPIMEFQGRSLKGPVMKSTQFDLAFAKKVRELVAKYEIQYNPEELIVDDKTADAVFEAGVELLSEVGLYHLDTQRVIEFGQEEVREVAREYRENPPKQVFGQGDDEITVTYRTSHDKRPPILAGGPAGSIDESWFDPYVIGLLRRYRVAFCAQSHPWLPDALERTSNVVYVRFHGVPKLYTSDYSEAALVRWADRIAETAGKSAAVYCYFNNDVEGYAVGNALRLREMLHGKIEKR